MGCLFRSFFLVIILVILFPVLFLMLFMGRAKVRTHTFRGKKSGKDNDAHDDQEEYDVAPRNNKPIDQSTVEYIDFEEVDDKKH